MKSPILTALLHPLNVFMVGLAIFAGLMSAWWLFPVGVVFWVVMVVVVSRDRALRFNAQMQSREPLAQRFQHHFDRIERAQVSIFNALAALPPQSRRVLSPIQEAVDRLVDAAYVLCKRMTSLENYRIVSESQSDFADEVGHLADLIERTEDDALRQDYIESRQALQERQTKLKGVATQLDRVEAQLSGVANELDAVMTEIVRLQAVGAESAAPQVAQMARRLETEAAELGAFESQSVRV